MEAQVRMVVGTLRERLAATGSKELDSDQDGGEPIPPVEPTAASGNPPNQAQGGRGQQPANKAADVLQKMIEKMKRQGAPAAQIHLMETLHRQAVAAAEEKLVQQQQGGQAQPAAGNAQQSPPGTQTTTAGGGSPQLTSPGAGKPLKKGDVVEANWMNQGHWYRGKVHEVHGFGPQATYHVHFDDGDIEDNIEASRVRRPGQGGAAQPGVVMMMMNQNGQWTQVNAGANGADLQQLLSQAGLGGLTGLQNAQNRPGSEMLPDPVSAGPKQSIIKWDKEHYRNI